MSAEIVQGSPEWLALRLGIPTGSGFALVMAEGRGKDEAVTRRDYRISKALEIITGLPQEFDFKSRDMVTGTEREPLARMAYEAETGHLVQEVAFRRAEFLNAGVSPDGEIDADGLVEFKCPKQATHLRYLARTTVPPEYHWQVHGEMLCTGRKWCDFVSYNPDFPAALQLHVIRVERDEAECLKLEAGIIKFNADVQAAVAEIHSIEQQRERALSTKEQQCN